MTVFYQIWLYVFYLFIIIFFYLNSEKWCYRIYFDYFFFFFKYPPDMIFLNFVQP